MSTSHRLCIVKIKLNKVKGISHLKGRTKYRQLTTPQDNSRQQFFKSTLTEHLNISQPLNTCTKSHMHLNHFQTVEKIVFLIVKKVFFTPSLVTNGNIRHVVFRSTWTIPLHRRGNTICKMITILCASQSHGVDKNIIFKSPLVTSNSRVAA